MGSDEIPFDDEENDEAIEDMLDAAELDPRTELDVKVLKKEAKAAKSKAIKKLMKVEDKLAEIIDEEIKEVDENISFG